MIFDMTQRAGGGGEETWYMNTGKYAENMVIPSSGAGSTRYVRDAYNGATHLKSFIQQYGTPSSDSDYGLFNGCTSLETVWVARATFGNYCFDNCTNLKHVTLGRVGLAVTSVSGSIFKNIPRLTKIEDVTVYVNASDLSGVPSAVKDRIVPSYSPGAVVTYKNYESGETIATVTVT